MRLIRHCNGCHGGLSSCEGGEQKKDRLTMLVRSVIFLLYLINGVASVGCLDTNGRSGKTFLRPFLTC